MPVIYVVPVPEPAPKSCVVRRIGRGWFNRRPPSRKERS